jgi:indoleacetamide hydrolase
MSYEYRLSRRQLLAQGLATAGCARLPVARSAWALASDESLLALTATEATRAIRHGEISAERYAQTLLRRCQQGTDLNAFITLRPESVLEAARSCDKRRNSSQPLGPLHGLPIPIKDSINTCEMPTTAGTLALRHFQPAEDAPLVHTLREAGAIILGKTNLHELSYGYTSNNHAYGTIHNPYDPTRIPGGSSGGTAAAIAYRMAPLGVAEDTEGSIRVPAALCGLTGLRPTTGRYSTEGCVPISPLFDQVGPHARSVADLLLFDQVIAGGPKPSSVNSLNGLRIGIIRSFWFEGLDAETERVTHDALQRLRTAGVKLVEGELPDLKRLISLTTDQVQNHDTKPALSRFLSQYHAGITFDQLLAAAGADVRRMIVPTMTPGSSAFVTEAQYRTIVETHLPTLRAMYRHYFESSQVSAIVFPTTMLPAPKIGEEDMQVEVRGRRMPLDEAMARNIAPGSTAGLPGLVLPAGLTSSGLPVSLEFDGPAGTDRHLLEVGVALESALGALPPPHRPDVR